MLNFLCSSLKLGKKVFSLTFPRIETPYVALAYSHAIVFLFGFFGVVMPVLLYIKCKYPK